MRFSTSKFQKFPVIFPVSREFSRRKVSARLRAPPYSLRCRETRRRFRQNPSKWPQCREFFPETGLEDVSYLTRKQCFETLFSEGHLGSPVSTTRQSKRNAITNR